MTVVFDLDGTTIFNGNKMTSEMEEAIKQLSSHRRIVFASARPIRDMLPVLPTDFHNYDLIGGNGAFVKQNNVLTTSSFSKEESQTIFNVIRKYKLNYLVDSSWDYSFYGDKEHPLYQGLDPDKTAKNIPIETINPIVKSVLFTTNPDIINELKKVGINVHFHGNEQLIDISPNGISKWTGFKQLETANGFIMFGNDANDIPMFKKASKSFIVGNLVKNIPNTTNIPKEKVIETILSLTNPIKEEVETN